MRLARQTRWMGWSVLGLILAAGSATAQVQWASGAPGVVLEGGTVAPAVLAGQAGKSGHILVRLTRPITDAGRAALSAQGMTILAPLGDLSFFASVSPEANAGTLSASDWLAGASAIDTNWKVHRDFLAGATPPWIIVEPGADPQVAIYVTMHEDVPAAGAGDVIAKHAGAVIGVMRSINAMVVHLPRSRVMTLATEDGVQWIEPALPQLEELNAQNRALVQADVVQAAPYGLNGAGVSVLVFDGGTIRATHQDLTGRVTLIDTAGQSGHATHVAGTVGGTGAASGGANRGMAPGVTMLSAGVNISGVSEWLYNNPCDIEQDYTAAWNQGADLATNSIGTNVSNNGFSCTWYGDYGTCAAVIDSIIRGSTVTQGNPFRVTWAAGNERTTSRCATPTGYFYLGPPAGAKNQMCIGSCDSNTDNLSNFSSVGPTDDGRMRPDFVAPGCQTNGDGGVTSCSSGSDTAYSTLCGTSMATPTVAGCCALLMQDFRALYPGLPDPRNSLLKVFFAQSAAERGNPGPDFFYGYGSVRVQNAIELMRMGNFQESQVDQNGDVSLDVTVPAGQTELVITLAWDDAPAAGNANPVLVNDLDLEVFAPNSGPQAFPWTLDMTNPSANAVRTQANRKDNIEQVKVENPAAGVWHVRVHGFNVPVGPQPFSIVASHQMTGGQPIPRITMSANTLVSEMNSGVTGNVAANVVIQNDTIVPGSALLHYRPNSAATWSQVPLTNTSGDVWAGTLPGFPCAANPEYYFTVTGAAFGAVSLPAGGANAPYGATIGVTTYFANDSFETDAGWVGGQPGDTANTGIWNRGAPEATTAQPGADHTPAPGTMCWATDTRAGAAASQFDVDGGFTTLKSPNFDLSSQPEAEVSWWWWYSNQTGGGPGANEDRFRVRVSNDNGANWVAMETIGPATPLPMEWRFSSYRVADFVTPNSTVSFTFVAVDLGAVSTVEAAIDDFVIKHHVCQDPPTCDPDVNCDGAVNGFDVQATEQAVNGDFSNFCQSSADLNGDGSENGFDIEMEEQRVNGAPC